MRDIVVVVDENAKLWNDYFANCAKSRKARAIFRVGTREVRDPLGNLGKKGENPSKN